jgi:hypothetical protein
LTVVKGNFIGFLDSFRFVIKAQSSVLVAVHQQHFAFTPLLDALSPVFVDFTASNSLSERFGRNSGAGLNLNSENALFAP